MNSIEETPQAPAEDAPVGSREKRLAILDTDPGVRWSLDMGLRRSGYCVSVVSTLEELREHVTERRADCLLMEILPEAGLTFDALSSLLSDQGAPPLICTSIDPAPEVVMECMRRGAADFLAKPFGLAEVRRALAGTLERTAQPAFLGESEKTAQDGRSANLIGVSPAMRELWTFVHQVAQTDLNCLIRGESGVGKDMIAREIHRLSQRRDRPFIKVNCTALPEALLESELFGYERGAFTGASVAKPGRFSLANEGMIFLDEIGDMQPSLQAKILQVIEHKEFTTVGGSKPTRVDVQIIAATNANLEENTASGTFRKDLYFRLNEISVWVPPLRERKEDVPVLVRHFIRKHDRYSQAGDLNLSGEDLRRLSECDWPGNIRELENTIKRWLVLGRQALSPGLLAGAAVERAPKEERQAGEAVEKAAVPAPKKRELAPEEILTALRANKWNRRKTAEALGIGYQALRRRIEKHGLNRSG